MSGNLLPLFVKVRSICQSGSKFDEDTVKCVTLIAGKLLSQFPEKCNFLLVEKFPAREFVMEIVSVHHSDPSTETTADSFNRILAHQNPNIPPDGFGGDMKFIRQIVASVIPAKTKLFQYFQTTFGGTYVFHPPPLLSAGDDKR